VSLEETLSLLLEVRMEPLIAEVRRLTEEIQALRRDLPPALVTMNEAARKLGVSLSTVKRRVRDGSLPARRLGKGRALRVNLAALHQPQDAEIARLTVATRLR
jgi:excisionase family DNA binding protein